MRTPRTRMDISIDKAKADKKTWLKSLESVRAELQKRCGQTSQRRVAGELGVSVAYVNDILKGKRNITDEMLEKLRKL